MSECDCIERPVDNTGDDEWTCPTCGRVWEYQVDTWRDDEFPEAWWEPRDS